MKRALAITILTTAAFGARAERSVQAEREAFSKIAERIEELKVLVTTHNIAVRSAGTKWEELEAFHSDLLSSAAVDPYFGENDETVSSQAIAKTEELKRGLDKLRKLEWVAKDAAAGKDFETYVGLADEVLRLRSSRRYSLARTRLKKSGLDDVYAGLVKSLGAHYDNELKVSVSLSPKDRSTLLQSIKEMQGELERLGLTTNLSGPAARETERLRDEVKRLDAVYSAKVTLVQRLLLFIVPIFALTCLVGGFLIGRGRGSRSRGKDRTTIRSSLVEWNTERSSGPALEDDDRAA